MKHVLSIAFVLSFTLSAFAGVKEDVKALGDLAMGTFTTKSKGKTAEQVLKKYVEIGTGEDTLVFKEMKDMDYGDEIDQGFTSVASAKSMKSFAQGAMEERVEMLIEMGVVSDLKEVKAIRARLMTFNPKWNALIEKLERAGVKFGYTGNGPGYCGVSFVEMLVIDPKAQEVHEVYLSYSGEC